MLYVALQQSFREEVGMEEVSFLSTSSIPVNAAVASMMSCCP